MNIISTHTTSTSTIGIIPDGCQVVSSAKLTRLYAAEAERDALRAWRDAVPVAAIRRLEADAAGWHLMPGECSQVRKWLRTLPQPESKP